MGYLKQLSIEVQERGYYYSRYRDAYFMPIDDERDIRLAVVWLYKTGLITFEYPERDEAIEYKPSAEASLKDAEEQALAGVISRPAHEREILLELNKTDAKLLAQLLEENNGDEQV